MPQKLATIGLLVEDHDEAVDFLCKTLGFRLVEDTPLENGKRRLVLDPGGGGARLLLARAVGADRKAAIGRQTGGRVGFFLETDDLARDFAAFTARGVASRRSRGTSPMALPPSSAISTATAGI